MKKYLILFLSLLALTVYAADKEKLEKVIVIGEHVILKGSSDETEKQAAEKARQAAKHEALMQVCGEGFNVWNTLASSNAGDSYNSLAINQMNGEIVGFEIIEEDSKDNPVRTNERIFKCTAKVTVKRGVESDPTFKAKIEGIKPIYAEGEELEFSVSATQDCYLSVFWMSDDTSGDKILPNSFESNNNLVADTRRVFPGNYSLVIYKNTSAAVERNKLVFAFTKDKIPFLNDETNSTEIETWLAQIRNDRKYIEYKVFDIRKK